MNSLEKFAYYYHEGSDKKNYLKAVLAVIRESLKLNTLITNLGVDIEVNEGASTDLEEWISRELEVFESDDGRK